MDEIVNKVEQSGLITLNLEEYYTPGKRLFIDLKDQLYQGLILKERDFRAFVKSYDWSQYQDTHIAIDISTDAIVPAWAFMLVATAAAPYASTIIKGSLDDLNKHLFTRAIQQIDLEQYRNKFVIIKGCSKVPVPDTAYVELSTRLQAVVKTLSYGEACSKVPLFKAKRDID